MAAGLSPFRPAAAAVAAGKLLLREFERLSKRRESFGGETTLAGVSWTRRLRRLRDAGYAVRLYFLWIGSAELAVRRMAARVAGGGHVVPEPVIRRRFAAGLARFRSLDASSFDEILVFDNSLPAPRPVAQGRDGRWGVQNSATWATIRGR